MIQDQRGRHIVGDELESVRSKLIARYRSGMSIRAIASDTGRSYGWVHRTLSGHVVMQPVGGIKGRPVSRDRG